MTEPTSQLTAFRHAVALLGGNPAAARAIGVSVRTVGYLLAGAKPLTTRHLRAIGAALILHADACRLIERQLSPAFTGNLTPRQAKRPATKHPAKSKG